VTAGATSPVSLCLLNYNGAPHLDRCLRAVAQLDPRPTEIIAVDNASPDGSGARLAAVGNELEGIPFRFVASSTNRGYAGGHNLGARHASQEFLAILNATVEPESAWLDSVAWLAGHPEAAFVQPATFHATDRSRVESLGSLVAPDGSLHVIGRDLRERPGVDGVYVAEVLSVLGAAFVARRSVFERLGGFDERFFMYFEETDLCWRGRLIGQGAACWFDPRRPTRAFHQFHGSHPPTFDVARYFEPNRTISMFRNLESRNLWRLSGNVMTVAGESARSPARFASYVREVVRRLPEAARQRRDVQGARRVPDASVFGLRPPEHLDRWFSE
jgi:GT2 family glycosyltransferase